MTIAEIPGDVLAGGRPVEAREERLESGAAELESGSSRSLVLHPRFLVAVAGALMSAGLAAIVLGWMGAARSILVQKQIPYLISGGLLGVALATIGALTFFTHWLTVLVRTVKEQDVERRRQHEELVQVLREERAGDHEALITAIRELDRRPVRRPPRRS